MTCKSHHYLFVITVILSFVKNVTSFNLVMMGSRRGKGGLKRGLDSKPASSNTINKGRGQEITGVSLPADGKLKGWAFGNDVKMVAANVGGRFYALQGDCARCGFDLWKGDLIADDPGFEDLPRVACPTCGTTYSLVNGKKGPALKRSGLAGFVGGLAKTATVNESSNDVKAFILSQDDEGRVYCRER